MINIYSSLSKKRDSASILAKSLENPESGNINNPNKSRVIVITSGKGGVGKNNYSRKPWNVNGSAWLPRCFN